MNTAHFVEMAMKKTLFVVFCLAALAQFTTNATAGEKYTFKSSREAGKIDRVNVLMEVGGELKEVANGKENRIAMSGVDKLTYQEMMLETEAAKPRSVRYYDKAESSVRFKDGGHTPKFADQHRLVGAAVELPATQLFALREPMTRDELEIIDILGNSLLLDNLLPGHAVVVGDTWKLDAKVMAAFLGLNSAAKCNVECKLKEVTEKVARFEFSGNIEGPVNDTKSRIDVQGRFRFDLRTKRIDWLAMLTHENRGMSQAADGFDVNVRYQMTIVAVDESPELSKEKLAGLSLDFTPESSRLRHQSSLGKWELTYDRDWHLNSNAQEIAVLKLIREGTMIGQCNVTMLPLKEADQLVSLEDFQEDVRRALGKSFGEFVEAKQSADSLGRRVLRVVARGTVGGDSADLPIEWVYYHLADKNGRQAAITFSIEQDQVSKFAAADRAMTESLRFVESDNRGPLAKRDLKAQTIIEGKK